MKQIELHTSDGEITVNGIVSLLAIFHMCNANFETNRSGKVSEFIEYVQRTTTVGLEPMAYWYEI